MIKLTKKGFSYLFVYAVLLITSASAISMSSYYYVKLQLKNIENTQKYESFMESELNNFEPLCQNDLFKHTYTKEIKNSQNMGLQVVLNCEKGSDLIVFNSQICLTKNDRLTNTCKEFRGSFVVEQTIETTPTEGGN